jgi:hypothetical protein
MCVVSNMVDSMREQWPPISSWPAPQVIDISSILDAIRALDEKLGAKDCHDPKKDKFLKELEERVKALEEANAINKGEK